MDDALPWVVLALALAFMLLALPAGVIVWIVRSARNAKLIARIDRLEREVAELREVRARAPEPFVAAMAAERETAREADEFRGSSIPSPISLAEQPRPAPVAPLERESVVAPRTEPIAPSPSPMPSSTSATTAGVAGAQPPISVVRSPPQEAPRPSPAPAPAFQWEQWIGVKGAALAAGALLALGALLFVQHAIRHGWIDAQARCIIAALCGAAAIGSSWPLRKRGYAIAADALTGAGVCMLFGATWAARVLYELIPFWLALLAMAAITTLCGALAARRRSQTIAVFGVLGGFATPLLLSLGANQPIGLFAYLLLLQGAVLALGRSRRWPLLAGLASFASPLVFLVWVATRYQEAHLPLALLFCGFSALGFALGASGGEGLRARLAPIVGALSPFFFAAYFAGSAQLQRHLVPIAILLAVLEASACWTALRLRLPGLVTAAGIGSVATVLTWLLTTRIDAPLAWECAAIVVALAAVPHVAFELASRRGRAEGSFADAVASSTLGFAALAIAAAPLVRQALPWNALAAPIAIAALCARATALGARRVLLPVASLTPILGFFAWRYFDFRGPDPIGAGDEAWLVVALAALPFAWAFVARAEMRSAAWFGAAGACIALLAERALQPPSSVTFVPQLATVSFVTALGLVAASLLGSWIFYALLGALVGLAHLRWSATLPEGVSATISLGFALATATAIGAVPLLDRARLGALRATWRMGAMLSALWTLPFLVLFERQWPELSKAAPLGAGAAVCAWVAVAIARERLALDEDGKRSARAIGFAWFAGFGVLLLAFALGEYVDHAELVIGGALACAGLAWLSRRARHAGLRVSSAFAAVYTAASVVLHIGLVLIQRVPEQRTGWPVVHWLSYEVGVPALAMFAAAGFSRVDANGVVQLERSVEWRPVFAKLSGWLLLAAILLLFAWVNVEVVNLCSTGTSYAFGFERHAARDVWLSVAWSLYALALLVVGVRLDRSSLRWTSLAFFVATAGKVFLYDMGELRGLYRVASLIGLALALLAVSLLYQRFVFRAKPLAPGPGADDSAGASRV